ncbi:hypothetical protein BDF21DRAFT_336561, partial [Thamnidium elegans]
FLQMLGEFMVTYAAYPDFMLYFKRQYLDDDAFVRWSAAFQPQAFTNMETNNYVEIWRNQLKATYLKRRPDKRVDRLIYVLVHDVGEDYE